METKNENFFERIKGTITNPQLLLKFLSDNAILVILFAILLGVGVARPNFVSFGNLSTIAINTAPRFIIALGISGCLITRGTDLSAGRIVGLGGCIAATLLQRLDYANLHFAFLPNLIPKFLLDNPFLYVVIVFVITILICMSFGFINGIIVSRLNVPPFIATLGMQQVVYSVCLVFSRAQPIGAFRPEYTIITKGLDLPFNMANGKPFSIPYMMIIAVVIGALMWFLYNKTKHGKYMYAIGGNETAAEVSGINTKNSKLKIYGLAGAMYGIAGILLAAKSGGASVNLGSGYELEAIAACTIGGVSTTGGVGKVSGIIIGVLVFELLKSGLLFMGVNTNYTYLVQGIVIIAAVAFDIRKYIAKK